MKFGPVAVAQARGSVLAHSIALPGGRLRKGVVLGEAELQALQAAGHGDVIVAQLEPGDVGEDAAATALALAVAGQASGVRLTPAFAGRVNILAEGPGVVRLDEAALRAVNGVDPMITIATVPPFQQMAKGGLIATIKIIAYGVAGTALAQAETAAGAGAIAFEAPKLTTARLIITEIPGGAGDKGRAAVAARLDALDVQLIGVDLVAHREADLAEVIANCTDDLVLVLTGSATSDPDDVAPAALRRAGGQVDRFGMPVDPGNLLFVGSLADRPVIGLPGCARSPALNGADWVLSRVVCGIPVTGADISAMGVGGLLKEIPTRPQPRRRSR